MGEYRFSGHAVWDIKYHLIWVTKYRYKILRGEVAELCPRCDPTDLPGSGGEHYPRIDLTGPRAYVGGGAAAVGAGKSGAIRKRTIVAPVARGVSEPAKAVLGTTPVGARVFLCDGGRGG